MSTRKDSSWPTVSDVFLSTACCEERHANRLRSLAIEEFLNCNLDEAIHFLKRSSEVAALAHGDFLSAIEYDGWRW
jgi:hypothetical protein